MIAGAGGGNSIFSGTESQRVPFPSINIKQIISLQAGANVYENTFKQLDNDGNGYLDYNEFNDGCNKLNMTLSKNEIKRVFNSISDIQINGQKFITLKSFSKFLKKASSIQDNLGILRNKIYDVIKMNKNNETIIDGKCVYEYIFKKTKPNNIPMIISDGSAFIKYDYDSEYEYKNIVTNYSQIISINNIDCSKDIKNIKDIYGIINNQELPINIKFRKQTGIDNDVYDADFNINDTFDDSFIEQNDEFRPNKNELEMVKSAEYSPDINDDTDNNNNIIDSELYSNKSKIYGDHCKYCPEKGTLRLKIHLTFEDESYSTLSYIIVSFVMCLIIISTVSYVLETIQLSISVFFVYKKTALYVHGIY